MNRDSFTFQGDLYDEGTGESVTATSYTRPLTHKLSMELRFFRAGTFFARWPTRLSEKGKISNSRLTTIVQTDSEPNFVDLRNTFDIDFLDRFRLPDRQQFSWGARSAYIEYRRIRFGGGVPDSHLSPTTKNRRDLFTRPFFQDEIGLVGEPPQFIAGDETHSTRISLGVAVGAERASALDTH